MKNWIWWVVFFPASILALFLGNLLGEFLCYFENFFWGTNGGIEDLFNTYILNPFQKNVISSFLFVFTGYYLAPKYKKTIGLIMMIVILCIGSISLFIINFINIDYYKNVGVLFAMIGSIFAYIYVLHRENKLKV